MTAGAGKSNGIKRENQTQTTDDVNNEVIIYESSLYSKFIYFFTHDGATGINYHEQ